MSLGLEITPGDVHQLSFSNVATVNSSRRTERARRAERLATLVDNEWEEFPLDVREAFTAFAYDATREPSGTSKRLRYWWSRKRLARSFARGGEEMLAVVEYVYSVHRLIDSILVAVEREDEEHQERLAAAAERAATEQGNGIVLNAEERRERLRAVSRRTLN